LTAVTLVVFASVGAFAPAAASFAGSQNVTVPGSGTQTTTWTGTIPAPSTHPASSCPNHLDPTADYEDIVLTVPANLYNANMATFTFAITWATASTTADEILSLLDSSDNVIQSSDGSTNTETVTVTNLAAGTYHVVACGFINQNATPYTGSLKITTVPTPPPPTPYPAANVSFGVPTVMDPIHTFGEPDIGVSALSNVFASGPAGTGTQRSLWEGSVDGGQTFRLICPAPNPLPSAVQGCNSPPGGGDTDIAFDHHSPQGQYFSDLFALAGFRVAATHDEGSTQPAQGVQGSAGATPEVDRQWFAVFDPPPNTSTSAYTGARPLVYNEFGPAPSVWTKSNDGINFTRADHNVKHFGADGYPSIDQVTGKVFEATYSGNSILLNIGTPQVTGDLCFLDATVAEAPCPAASPLITVASGIINSGDVANFVVSSMDSARNLYVVWVGRSGTPSQRQVFVSAASAASNWTTWFGPVQVSDGTPQTGDAVNVFPWIKAGGSGLADAVWYGDSSGQDPSNANSGHVWNVFMSPLRFPTDANGGVTGVPAAGSLSIAKVTPHPMDYLDICLSGTGCIQAKGNRNLADFFQVNMGNDGAAEIIYDDMSNGLIQTGPMAPSTPADHPGAAVVTIARQNSGVGLLGSTVVGPSAAPVSGLADTPSDALYPVMGGTSQPALDLLSSSLGLSGTTLTVTMKVADLGQTALTNAAQATQGTDFQYVTRWQMGNTLYYAEMYGTPANLGASLGSAQFSAGKTQSIDLCSVSACDPHVLTYPEVNPPDTMPEITGSSATCPPNPGINSPCTITISVNTAHVGSPTGSSLLEEVGAYAFASARPQSVSTNAQAQVDQVPLEVDGVCCYNFQGSGGASVPEFPIPVAALFGALAILGGGIALGRVRGRKELVA
jgi:hypothetical protein